MMEKSNIGANAAKLAGLLTDLLQKFRKGLITLSHIEWFNNLSKEKRDRFLGLKRDVSGCFKKLNSYLIDEWYSKDTPLKDSKDGENLLEYSMKKDGYKNKIIDLSREFKDVNFANPSYKFDRHGKYVLKLFQIEKPVTPEECIDFLKSQNAILTGAQGLVRAWEETFREKGVYLPSWQWFVSLDEKSHLWEDEDGYARVPFLYIDFHAMCISDGYVVLRRFEDIIGSDTVLICWSEVGV